MSPKIKHIFITIGQMLLVGMLFVILYIAGRIFVFDQFFIPTYSMAPTLLPGDRVVVNKLIFGARIYQSFNFSAGASLKMWRMPRVRPIKRGDVVVFNLPHGFHRGKIEFKINYVYCKRCIGLPGDSVSIVNGFFRNSRTADTLGYFPAQKRLSLQADSLLTENVRHVLPYAQSEWTIKEMSPLYVPAQGEIISLNTANVHIYKRVIEYETRKELSESEGMVLLDGEHISKYQFVENYYFCCGDNVENSNDSRYWGFVPEDFIIGVAKLISYSRNTYTGEYNTKRILRRIE